LASKGLRLDFRPHKVYFFEFNIKHQNWQYFIWKWKRSQKFVWELPDGIFFWGQKWKVTPVKSIPSVIQKEKSLTWKHLSKIGRTKFSFGLPWIHGRRQSDGFFFFRKNRPNSSRKSIIFFLEITKSVLYINFVHRK
jgi:hypothetical protein